MGRPSEYTQEAADLICFEIAQGKSLRTVLKLEGTPEGPTFYRWLREHDDFRKQYTQACKDRADAQFEDLNGISEEAMEDVLKYKGDPKLANVIVAVHKLKAENMKWAMAKMKPKKYSEKLELDDLPPNAIVFVNEVPTYSNKPTGDLLPDDKSDSKPHTG